VDNFPEGEFSSFEVVKAKPLLQISVQIIKSFCLLKHLEIRTKFCVIKILPVQGTGQAGKVYILAKSFLQPDQRLLSYFVYTLCTKVSKPKAERVKNTVRGIFNHSRCWYGEIAVESSLQTFLYHITFMWKLIKYRGKALKFKFIIPHSLDAITGRGEGITLTYLEITQNMPAWNSQM
jgi:hypothetical protein